MRIRARRRLPGAAPPRAQDHLRYNGLNILSADISTDPETGLIVDSFQA